MAIIKASEPLGPRPVIIAWYGDPGIGKTSLFNTCKNPLLVDGDRGVSRSTLRKDTLVINSWDEVLKHEKDGDFKNYATIGIDTPKAILDDFLMKYVINQDYKLRTNKLGAYGAIGAEFSLFLNNRRDGQADIAIICHARKDDDTKRWIPDVTGQSLNLILRVADMIGYYTMQNGRRMLAFDPTDTTFGKNVARIPPIEVPDSMDPAFKTFMADIFERVRAAIASHSEEQLEAQQKSALYQEAIQACETLEALDLLQKDVAALPDWLKVPLYKLIDDKAVLFFAEDIKACDNPDDLTAILEAVNALRDSLKLPLQKAVSARAKEKCWVGNKETKRYEAPAGQGPATGAPAVQGEGNAEEKKEEPFVTGFDDRVQAFGKIGMTIEMDRVVGFGIAFTWEMIGEWTEDQYINAVTEANAAKKAPKGRLGNKRQTAAAR